MRLRIQLDRSLAAALPNYEQFEKFWWQPSGPEQQTVGQLLGELAAQLGINTALLGCLRAELEGFAVLHSSGAGLLREGDLLLVKLGPLKRKAEGPAPAAAAAAAAAELPSQPAKRLKQASPGGTRALKPLLGATSSSEEESESESESESGGGGAKGAGKLGRSSSEPSSSSTSGSESEGDEGEGAGRGPQDASPGAKSDRFFTPAAKLASPGSGDGAGKTPGAGAGTGGAGSKQRPSRSARRKAAKRRLRREGVLPPSTGKKGAAAAGGQPAQQQPAVAAAEASQGQGREQGTPVAEGHAAPAVGQPTAAAGPTAKRQKQAAANRVDAALQAAAAADALNPHAALGAKGSNKDKAAGRASGGWGVAIPVVCREGHVKFSESDDEGAGEEEEGPDNVLPQQQPQQQEQQGRGEARPAAPQVAVSPRHYQPAAAEHEAELAAAPPPMAEEEFGRLPAVAGDPIVGSVVAYKLLEIGPDFAPQVSEVRQGRVAAFNAAGSALTLAPHPEGSTHPLTWQWTVVRARRAAEAAAAGEAQSEEEVEEDEELELGLYEEDGSLTTELSSFVELRLLRAGPAAPAARQPASAGPAAAPAPAAVGEPPAVSKGQGAAGKKLGAAGAAAVEDLGPSSYSQLGPPRPPTTGAAAGTGGTPIVPEGGWASLYQQLQKRRAELAQREQQPAVAAPRQAAPATNGSATAVQQQPAAGSAGQGRGQRKGATVTLASASGGKGAQVNGTAVAGAPAAQQRQQQVQKGGGRKAQGLTPGATKPRGGVRASAMGPILRMLRSSNELQDE